jgi:hypothetical protein
MGPTKLGFWLSSSCPTLCRASTSWLRFSKKDVDGRDEPGHDEKAIPFRNELEMPDTFSVRLSEAIGPGEIRSRPDRKPLRLRFMRPDRGRRDQMLVEAQFRAGHPQGETDKLRKMQHRHVQLLADIDLHLFLETVEHSVT